MTLLKKHFPSLAAPTRVNNYDMLILLWVMSVYGATLLNPIFATLMGAFGLIAMHMAFHVGVMQKRVFLMLFAGLLLTLTPVMGTYLTNGLYIAFAILALVSFASSLAVRHQSYDEYVSRLVRKSKLAKNNDAWPPAYRPTQEKALKNRYPDIVFGTIHSSKQIPAARLLELMARQQLVMNNRHPDSVIYNQAKDKLLGYKKQLAAL